MHAMKRALMVLALTGCGDEGSDFCPGGTTERLRTDADRTVHYCVNAADVAHGPYREELTAGGVAVEGAFANGQPDGVWRYRFAPGTASSADAIQYEQEWADGLEHGTWTAWDANGAKSVEQHFDHARRCDTWYTWSGEIVTSEVAFPACASLPEFEPPPNNGPGPQPDWDGETCPDGADRLTASDREGEAVWCEVDGTRHGPYRYASPETLALGRYLDGARDGKWRVWRGGVATHESTWVAGTLEGPSFAWYPNGAPSEVGSYAAGLRTGPWTWHYPNGLVRQMGSYEAGVAQGVWETYSTSGVVTEHVEFQAGLRQGEYKSSYDDGAPECTGAYDDDLRAGTWTCRHLNGEVLHTGPYVDGQRHGGWQGFDSDGQPRFEGPYFAGNPEGTWKLFYDSPLDGERVVTQGEYKNGWREGEWVARWVDDNVLASRTPYAIDRIQGTFTSFHRNGQIWEQGLYVNGEPHERWLRHYPDGSTEHDIFWYYGVRHGTWLRFWPNGQPRFQGEYRNGVMQPGAEAWSQDGTPLSGVDVEKEAG